MSGKNLSQLVEGFLHDAGLLCRQAERIPVLVVLSGTDAGGNVVLSVAANRGIDPGGACTEYFLTQALRQMRRAAGLYAGEGPDEEPWTRREVAPPTDTTPKPRSRFHKGTKAPVRMELAAFDGEQNLYFVNCPHCGEPCRLALEGEEGTGNPTGHGDVWSVCTDCEWACPLFRKCKEVCPQCRK